MGTKAIITICSKSCYICNFALFWLHVSK